MAIAAREEPPYIPVRCFEGVAEELACANCAVTIPEDYEEVAGWRYWSDGLGELHLFCEICSAREFSADAPATTS